MCSINGFNFYDRELLNRMNITTSHRGQDANGVFIDEGVSLGHNRLSIIDLSSNANQPMSDNEKELIIVFNGEIYNFQEIKKELEGEYEFKTKSDTEVILAGYKKWGKDVVCKLNGMFAFAIWDKRKQELFCARDHVGIKPFYYFWDGKRFIFASEIKAILEHNLPRILNRKAFNHYLRVLYVPEPLTMFEGIKKLPPASRVVLKGQKLDIDVYWSVNRGSRLSGSKREIALKLERKVEESVRSQLVSDRPLGIYLSGGIDSSVILDCVSRIHDNTDTFSVGFKLLYEEQAEKFNQDFYLARRTAKHYGTNHNEILLDTDDVLDMFEKMVWHLDEPISNPTALAMMKIADFAKNKVDVVLGGDGGDELFGGYDRYRMSLAADYWQKIMPVFVRKSVSCFSKKAKKLNISSGIDRFALFMFQKDNILQYAVKGDFLDQKITRNFFEAGYFLSEVGTEKLMETDRKSWLVDFSLMLIDKMSMSSGLEVRVPFLDKELVEYASRIPLKHKVNLNAGKIILKEAFKDRIPEFLLSQPKRGWFSPGAKWLRSLKIYEMVRNILSENYYDKTAVLFEWSELQKILEDHRTGKEYNFTILWAILTFQIWAKRYKVII